MRQDPNKIDLVCKKIYQTQTDNMIKELAFEMHVAITTLKRMIYQMQEYVKTNDPRIQYIKKIDAYKCTDFSNWDVYYREEYVDMGKNLIDSHMFYFDFINIHSKQRYHIQGNLDYWL